MSFLVSLYLVRIVDDSECQAKYEYLEEHTSQAKVLPEVVSIKVARTLHALEIQNLSIILS